MRPPPPEIVGQIQEAQARLLAEFQTAWQHLEGLLADVAARPFPSAQGPLERFVQDWLVAPLEALRKRRPLERVLDALEAHERWRREFAAEIAPALPAVHEPRLVADLLRKLALRTGASYGQFVALMAQAALEVLTPWQVLRRAAQLGAAGISGGPDPRLAHATWNARLAGIRLAVNAVLQEIGAPPHLKLPRKPSTAARAQRLESRLQQRLAWWRRLTEAARGIVALEESLWLAAAEIQRLTVIAAERVAEERQQLLEEIQALTAWLERPASPAAVRHTSLLSAEERITTWIEESEAAARRLVPGQIETAVRWQAMPGWRAPWRLLRPQRVVIQELDQIARPRLLAAFREAEATHRAAVQDMERVRQVMAFSRELAEREGESGRAAAREALANAMLLLRHRRRALPDLRDRLAEEARHCLAAAWYKVHLELERDRLGLLRYAAREGARQLLLGAREKLAIVVKATARFTVAGWRRVTGHLLARIGWERGPARPPVHVERREVLGEALRLDLEPRELPLIYQRLFRPQPVEDPRFLVGREAEMAAMAELRRRWDARRPASALVVGERGSGKTSLLNCALARVFPDVEVVRAEFRERFWTADQMVRFLREHVGLEPGRRAVVIIEELERAWLRAIGGYEALRVLLSQIVLTSRQLLWILAMNQAAFRLLNAALGLEHYFSHRINAGTVKQEDLREAILLRHNLTGLRLHFLAPQDSRATSALRRRLGLQLTPEHIFFQALYRESEGLFRSAFELWLRHIERGQEGVLYVRPLEAPRYDSLLADLALEDLLTLQALLQHGGLTVEEHALVFGIEHAASLDRLEILEDRELVEPDPGRPGFRVRPEAARAVRVALHRRNLL